MAHTYRDAAALRKAQEAMFEKNVRRAMEESRAAAVAALADAWSLSRSVGPPRKFGAPPLSFGLDEKKDDLRQEFDLTLTNSTADVREEVNRRWKERIEALLEHFLTAQRNP